MPRHRPPPRREPDVAHAPVAPPAAAGQAPHGPAAQRQREARGRVHRRRRRPADHQDARPPVEAADRRPRRAAVRLVQLEESDAFVSQPVDGVIYVARRSLKRIAKFLWSAIEAMARSRGLPRAGSNRLAEPIGVGSPRARVGHGYQLLLRLTLERKRTITRQSVRNAGKISWENAGAAHQPL